MILYTILASIVSVLLYSIYASIVYF